MELSQKFKLSITLWAIILFVIMFISLATADKEEIIEEEIIETPVIVCPDELFNEYGTGCVEHINDRYPWKLTESGDSQLMPELEEKTSHDRFKELCYKYWLNPSAIWEVENKYWIKEAVILCIIVSETSWWHRWYWTSSCNNVWNVYNTDSWNRQCFNSYEEWLEAVWKTLNNKYLFNIWTLGCLSNAWSCKQWDNNWHRYATSNWNRERNMVSCLSAVYDEQIIPSDFIIRR